MSDDMTQERRDTEGGETRTEIKRGRQTSRGIYALAGGFILFFAVLVGTDAGLLPYGGGATTDEPANGEDVNAEAAFFQPPPESAIPPNPSGDAIRRGMQLFMNTQTNAREFVGNGLNCSNCHLDGGRRPHSAPMWAAWVQYPKYRSKNKKINTMEDRINGCFSYSMNAQGSPSGGPPPKGHDVYKDLQSYFYWLATGAPTGAEMRGAGYPELKKTSLGYDPARGRSVFQQNCASCHGADGQGKKDLNGRYIFPPLWGPDSFNWGAGMARVNTAAAFIKANMPLGQPNRLSDQQAWDVAAFVDSHERPRDPRQKGTIAEAAQQFHSGEQTFYGRVLDGRLLGEGTGPSGQGNGPGRVDQTR
jgi:thiosulfate dehydrogenase